MDNTKRLKKLRISYFELAERSGNIRKNCHYFGISPVTYTMFKPVLIKSYNI